MPINLIPVYPIMNALAALSVACPAMAATDSQPSDVMILEPNDNTVNDTLAM